MVKGKFYRMQVDVYERIKDAFRRVPHPSLQFIFVLFLFDNLLIKETCEVECKLNIICVFLASKAIRSGIRKQHTNRCMWLWRGRAI